MTVESAALSFAWLFIVMLYLGLAHLLVALRVISVRITDLERQRHAGADRPPIQLPYALSTPELSVAAFVDADCASCWALAELLERKAPLESALVVHEDKDRWSQILPRLMVIEDADAWSSIAPLAPPVLVRVDNGQVADYMLPTGDHDARAAIKRWVTHRKVR